MIKLENTILPSPEQWIGAILGARNAMNSWDRSDSYIFHDHQIVIGPNDHDLMMRLAKGGSVHAKYRRMIPVMVNITAPLYWWKEADTYCVGVSKNSCSTMHKIHAKEFTLDDFSCEHLKTELSRRALDTTIEALNILRTVYLEGGVEDVDTGHFVVLDLAEIQKLPGNQYIVHDPKSKEIWDEMIQLLPSSYNQKRTVMLNYEVLVGMYRDRKAHKLDEWHVLCDWIEGLPYSELITGGKENE